MRTHVRMFENLQLKGLCVGHLLYMYTFVCTYMYMRLYVEWTSAMWKC